MILFHCVLCAFAVSKIIKKITAKTQSLFGLLKVGGNQILFWYDAEMGQVSETPK